MTVRYRTRTYKQLLTPTLHRRFRSAAYIALIICYLVAVIIGERSSWLWWFPIGRTGIRTLLLYISSLAVFVLRVAQLHLDARNTVSPFDTFRQIIFRFNTIQTLSWYLFSTWWFSEVYFWSASDQANFSWILEGKPWEKKRLNERPIYLRSVFFLSALFQAFFHLYYEYDRVFLPTASRNFEANYIEASPITPSNETEFKLDQRPHTLVTPFEKLKNATPSLLQRVARRSVGMSVSGALLYAIFIRRRAWRWALSLAQLLWDMPAAATLSYLPPDPLSLLFRSLVSEFLLILLWESSNTLFGVFVAQEPLKKGQLLSDESRDANGSLLSGLQARREVIKTIALWELVYISHCSENRRKLIFEDIDRPGGPAWDQIRVACVDIILGITNRITQFQCPSKSSMPQQGNLESLPRLSAPLRQDNVLKNPPPPTTNRAKIESSIGAIAKSYGQHLPSQQSGPLLSPRAKQYISVAGSKLLTQETQEQLQKISPAGLKASFNRWRIYVLRSRIGLPFRQTFDRRVRSIVLGSPNSQFGQIVDAIDALSNLTVASLKEDKFGKVAKDVSGLIQTYAKTIRVLQDFVAAVDVHWTDVEFQSRKVEEVDLVLGFLKRGLRAMVAGFGGYARDLGISEQDLAMARNIADEDVSGMVCN